MVYYTIRYLKPNSNLRPKGVATTPLVADIAKKLGSLRFFLTDDNKYVRYDMTPHRFCLATYLATAASAYTAAAAAAITSTIIIIITTTAAATAATTTTR